jgi:diguanylate cyclase (GGDEF)-like protein
MGGDQVLKSLALFLKQRLRKSDHIGRYNGARFAMILPDTNETEAKIMLNEIRERFAQLEQHYRGEGFFALFSAGVTNFDGESLKTFCERTEKALSTTKRSGRNTVQTSK